MSTVSIVSKRFVRLLAHRTTPVGQRAGFFYPPCIIAVLGLWTAAVAAPSPLYPDVELRTADQGGVRFVFRPAGWQIDAADGSRVAVSFDEAQWSTEPGAPAIPQRSVLVAVPPAGNVTVSAVPAGWRTVARGTPAVRGVVTSGAAGRDTRPVSPPLLRYDGPFWSRNVRLVRIWLAPVQPQDGQLVSTSEIQVDVRWSDASSGTGGRISPLFEPIIRQTVLNFEQARTLAATASRAPTSNPFAEGSEWYRVHVTLDGPHRITFGQLQAAGFPVSVSNPQAFRLFYAGGRTLPVRNSDARPILHEVAIEVTGSGNGAFDPGDEIYFFGQAAERWENRDSTAEWVHNPYTREVVYWLAPSGTWASAPLRIGTRVAMPGADAVQSTGTGRVTTEQNNILNERADDFFHWYWDTTAVTALVNLPGALPGPGRIAVSTRPTFNATNNTIRLNGVQASFLSSSARRAEFSATNWLPSSTIDVQYNLANLAWIDRIEAIYPAQLNMNLLRDFWLEPGTGNRVQLVGVPAGAILWDITATDSPVVITGNPVGGTLEFDPAVSSSERRFRVWTRPEASSPVAIRAATPGALRDNPPAVDLVTIVHPVLRAPLESDVPSRESQSGLTADIVDVQDVYDEFGFGMFDPIAIRDFLKYTYETSASPPQAALLVGDGSYDFRNYLGTGTANRIPPFIVDPILDETVGDQMYVSFGPLGTLDADTSRVSPGDRGWDMMIARWPVRDAAEAQIMADKIRSYETSPEFGLWRNRVVMVADDEFGEPPSNREFFHAEQAEGIETHIPDSYDRRKIYLFEYTRDASGQKPEARRDLVKMWNEGMILIDYVGHGSPDVWAHEDVFRRTRDLPQLFNANRLPLVYTASCSIGFFDDPKTQGMGEELVRRAAGGAVAVISATRLVFSQPNVDLNEAVLDFMLGPTPMTIGQALFAGLIARQYSIPGGPIALENDRKHVLLGDPLVRLAQPIHDVRFDTASLPDSLVALRPIQVKGETIDSAAAPIDLGGNLILSVRDAPRERQYEVGTHTVFYTLEGRRIFEGAFANDSSGFDLSFLVPKDVSYGADGARIVVYVEGTRQDALGVIAPLPVAVAGDSTSDTQGPIWSLTINGRKPEGRLRVGPADIWEARITDSLGVNIGGGGHGISVTVDGDAFSRRDITDLFRYDVGSFSSGAISFTLPDLAPGHREIQLLAWDNANNPGMLDVSVDASGDQEYEIRDLLAYPNPFDPDVQATTLTYELTFPPDRVTLSLFTVAGNRIRIFEDTQADIGYNYGTRWDGTDDVGDRVAAGIYILAIEAESAGNRVKDFTKIVLIRSD